MAEKVTLVADTSVAARELGWRRQPGTDAYDIARMIFRQARGLSVAAPVEPRWLWHAYEKLCEEFPTSLRDEQGCTLPDDDEDPVWLGTHLPSVWLPFLAVAADGGRRPWRAALVLRALIRVQDAMIRHSTPPLGRATEARDDGRARECFLLAREEELVREVLRSSLFSFEVGGASRASVAGAMGDDVSCWSTWDDGGWSDGRG